MAHAIAGPSARTIHVIGSRRIAMRNSDGSRSEAAPRPRVERYQRQALLGIAGERDPARRGLRLHARQRL